MPECTYSPAWATLSYGMTYNQAYTITAHLKKVE